MVGKLQWLKLRSAVQAKQGKRFDIPQFHAVGLSADSTALDVLARAPTAKTG